MPQRQPFTALCRATSCSRLTGRADLHLHTTHSDGTYSPAQIVDLARRSGLVAVAITDHDTLAGVAPARQAAAGTSLEVIAGVEISCAYREKELHLLGYFVDPEDGPLSEALHRLREHRCERFWGMVERLRGCGVSLDEGELRTWAGAGALGRRQLAEYLVLIRKAGSVREAFTRYLADGGRADVPKVCLPVAEALRLVRGAGGVASWAHPSYDCDRSTLDELRGWGLSAVEVDYPGIKNSRRSRLRSWASELGLAVSGGSDCHGPDHPRRAVGAGSVTRDELEQLRQRAHTPPLSPRGRGGKEVV
jgi:predicted metal-dependent phosphoesterase TrpH